MSRLILTPGDPLGIGPEVTVRALAAGAAGDRQVIVAGDGAALARAGLPASIPVFDPGDAAEPVEVASIRWAVAECLAGRAAALVTGPIHKAKLAKRGFHHAGHTGFLGELCGVDRPVMAFVGGSLRVALVTVHLPLRAVADAVTTELVRHTVATAEAALRDQLRLSRRRIAVCGLNPHAGDEGLLGTEERDVIAPAVAELARRGADVVGPISAETAFLGATAGEYDLVVAMYHDQGLAPLKAVDFGRSVNWTLGLPVVRTSVDHGTAYSIVGTGKADPASMIAALALARDLTAR
jgi:4-hydroxythreonine-4-phosphate dehydrogenase